MAKTLYLDIFSGISGDMFLGALLDLGLDLDQLRRDLEKLDLGGYHLHATRKENASISGIKFDVHFEEHEHGDELEHEHEHAHGHEHGLEHGHAHEHEQEREHGHEHTDSRDFSDIQQLIGRSTLSDWVKQRAIAVFRRVAVAEGKVHGRPPEQVHFHEVGAVDSIVDIVGACLGLEWLGRPRVLAAPVVEGTGWVNCAHGRFPVPTTATLEILAARGISVTQCEEPHELVTPTGAALLAEFCESFGPMRDLVPVRIGYGLGTRRNRTRPNVLRAILAESAALAGAAPASTAQARDWETDQVAVLETNLDDCPAELLGSFLERALAAGALDVFHTAIQMKKNRPGVLLTVLCTPGEADRFTEMLLRETSAFGVRRSVLERRKLRREWKTVSTPYGDVSVKLGLLNGQVLHAAPEFESCRQVSEQRGLPLATIYQAACQASVAPAGAAVQGATR